MFPHGRTGIEKVNVSSRIAIQKKPQNKNYIVSVTLSRTLYQGQDAPWRFEYIFSKK